MLELIKKKLYSKLYEFTSKSLVNKIYISTVFLIITLALVLLIGQIPKLLQKQAKKTRGAIKKRADSTFKKVEKEMGDVIENKDEKSFNLESESSSDLKEIASVDNNEDSHEENVSLKESSMNKAL